MNYLSAGRLRRAIKPVFVLAMIMTLAAGCGSPAVNPAALPTSTPPAPTQPAPTQTPTIAATATEIAATPTATAIDPLPTPTDATPVTLPVTGSDQVGVVNDTLCYGGPGETYGVMSSLFAGTSVSLIGKGAREGWYIVLNPTYKLPCWIAEADLQLDPSFDTSALKVYPVPVIPANLVLSRASLLPSPPVCKEQFTITVRVTNEGPGSTLIGGTIMVTDLRSSDDSTVTSSTDGFPTLNAGQTYTAYLHVTVKKYPGEEHQILITVDSNGQIVETNKNDNTISIKYTLDQGSCT